MKINITVIIIVITLIILFLVFSKKRESYRLRAPPKLPLIPVSNNYILDSLYENYVGYYYAYYYTSGYPTIYSFLADNYTALQIIKGFETTPVIISWNITSYINEENYVFVDSFQLNCGNYCNINNATFHAYCTSGDDIDCAFNPQVGLGAISYSAVESPILWPRYFSSKDIKRKIAGKRDKNKIIKYSDPPTLMILIVNAQYNPN